MTDRPLRVVIVGAGLTGLVTARELVDAGAVVTLVDKGPSVGGRLATRRIGHARLDHGAQFFTVRTPAFQARVDGWMERGLVRIWSHGFSHDDGYPRYIGTDGMNSLAKDLASGLEVECSTMAFAIRGGTAPTSADDDGEPTHRWTVAIDDGTERPADAVVLTCPLPQSMALLVDLGHHAGDDSDFDVSLDGTLFRTEYDRTISLLVTLDGPSAVPEPGAVQDADTVFSFVADNTRKGVSPSPAATFNANAEWSESHWDDDPEELLALLEEAARPWLGTASIIERQLKKWRFATPRTIWPDPCWTTGRGSIVIAGDAFAGPRVEGAHNSGLAAAHALLG